MNEAKKEHLLIHEMIVRFLKGQQLSEEEMKKVKDYVNRKKQRGDDEFK